jgi:hypothetical protein
MGKTVQFNKIDNNLFGQLKVKENEKPKIIVSNRSQGLLKLVINNFSKFKESKEARLSDKLILRNLEWKIQAHSTQQEDGSFGLGYYLNCNENNNVTKLKRFPVWVKMKLKLLNIKDEEKNRVRGNI